MIVSAGAVQIEYQRNGAGSFQVIAPNETKMILGITNADQIGFRRSDYATARTTQTTTVLPILINTASTYSCSNLQLTVSNNSTFTAFSSVACVALLVRNASNKDATLRINGGSNLTLRKFDSLLVRGITNANQVTAKAWDDDGKCVLQGETFSVAPPDGFQLTNLRKAEFLSDTAMQVPERVTGSGTNGPFSAFATPAMYAPFARWKKKAQSITVFNTAANAVISGGTTADLRRQSQLA